MFLLYLHKNDLQKYITSVTAVFTLKTDVLHCILSTF